MLNVILLIMIVVLPFVIPMLFISMIFGDGEGLRKKSKNALILHADKGLSEQGLLWLSVTVPLTYSIVFGMISWQGHSILLTAEGLRNFLSISAFPLAMLSLSLPLSVLVSRLHSTKQTAEQIKITKLKNNIDLFNAHRKDLFSYFSQIGEVDYLGCIKAKYKLHPRVHKNFFKGSPASGTPVYCLEAFEDIEIELRTARRYLDAVIKNTNPKLTYSLYIANFCPCIYRLGQKLGVPEIYVDLAMKSKVVQIDLKGRGKEKFMTVGTSTNEAVAAFRYISNFFDNLCDFAGYDETLQLPESLKYLHDGDYHNEIGDFLVIEDIHLITIPMSI